MDRPLQPQFKIRVFNGKKVHLDTLRRTSVITSSDDDFIDIEPCVTYPVIYEEQASLLNTLSFTVARHADLLLYYFYIGQSIIMYGGYYTESQIGMRHVFSGTVTRIRTHFNDSGLVTFTVECMNYGFTKMGKDNRYFVYPDSESSRVFATKNELTLKDIIEGIAAENNFEVGKIDLSSAAKSVRFTKVNIRYQKGVTDWKFLSDLAEEFGCNLWISSENGIDRINFASKEKSFRDQSEISFLFPLYGVIKDIKDSEIQKFSNSSFNRPRLLRNVLVDEDISQAYAVSRSAMYFDKQTGEYKEAVSQITTDKDGKTTITFYELDESKVEYVSKTFPDIAKEIRDGSPTSLPWGTPDNPRNASYYYTVKKVYDEQTAVFDRAFFGITVSARCNQDLDIRSQRTYKIRGILSYHSKNLDTSFFLRGLKQVWDTDGTWTELDFIR